MGAWEVDNKQQEGVLFLRLSGQITTAEMHAFVKAHNRAIDGFAGRDYRVFCDIRELKPMNPECAEMMATAKVYSSQHVNFRGSAVLVSGAIAAMQHQRTSVSAGVMSTELISESEEACRAHLLKINRHS